MKEKPKLKLVRDAPPGKLRVVVTYLELTGGVLGAQVARRTPAEKIALLRAERPPLSFYRYLYAAVGEPWLWYERRRLSDPELAAVIHDPAVEIYVLYKSGVPAGFAEIDRRSGRTVELQYLGLVPDFIGSGLGSRLLGWALDAAFAGGAHRITVNTCSFDHPKALATYQRAGFVPVGQEVRIIDDPRKTGLLPPGAAPHVPIVEE